MGGFFYQAKFRSEKTNLYLSFIVFLSKAKSNVNI